MTKIFLKSSNLIALLLLFFIISCKKSETPSPTPSTNTNTKTDTTTHIYLAGWTGTVTTTNAALWKDDVLKNISPDVSKNSMALCVTANDTDVYVGGYTSGLATYWKNETPIYLNNEQYTGAEIYALAFNGTYIYAVGHEISNNTYVASYWKNDIRTPLASGSVLSNSSGVVFYGKDLYISGGYRDNNYNFYPVYWKNGIQQNLAIDLVTGNANSPQYFTAYATGLAVLGTDVYVCGYTTSPNGKFVATYWKNGTEIKLTDGLTNAMINCIAISGSDVYMGGVINNSNNKGIATYWKNGVAVSLTDNSTDTQINALCVHNKDVYFAGITYDAATDVFSSMYWKNGIVHNVQQSDGTRSIVYGITVTGGSN